MTRPALLPVFAFASLVLAAAPARAEEPHKPRDPAAADALFQSARDAMTKGDLATACPRFAESQRLDPAPGTLLNLAACEEKQGKLSAARAHFQEALDAMPSTDYRVAYAKEQLAAVDKRFARVTVKVTGGGAGAHVRRDGLELREGALGVALPTEPGAHVFVVEAPGRAPSKVAVTFAEGEEKTLELAMGAPSGVATTTEAAPASSANGRKIAGIAALAVGGAGIVTGAVTGLMFADAASTYKQHCDATSCDDEGRAAARTGKTLDIVSPVAFGVGVLGLGAGAYLLLTGKSETAPSRTSFRATPQVGAGTAGMSLSGTF